MNAEHEETAPRAPVLVINRLTHSLAGQTQAIRLTPGSRVHRAYGQGEVTERFQCNFGLNPAYRERIAGGKMLAAGVDLQGEVRIVELADHPFYVATLFLPQVSSAPEQPHPLIVAYLQAAMS